MIANDLEKIMEELNPFDSFKNHYDGWKPIIDPIYGAQKCFPHEATIIDLAVVQRLKRIHQTGLVYHLYPAATHTRFDHSLGVMCIADEMYSNLVAVDPQLTDHSFLLALRTAALLHDIGHGPFSHSSEKFLSTMTDFIPVIRNDSRLSCCKPHEAMSYLMLSTKVMKDFFEELCAKYNILISLELVKNLIIGQRKNEPDFRINMINGPIDADRLDYIVRDSYFTGLNTNINPKEIVQSLGVSSMKKKRELIFYPNSIPVFEKMFFNKAFIYSNLYNDWRLRNYDLILSALLRLMRQQNESINGITLDKSANLLRIDDYRLLSHQSKDQKIDEMISDLNNGKLMTRALILSRRTIENGEGLLKLLKMGDEEHEIDIFKSQVVDEMVKKCHNLDILVDIPLNPSFREIRRIMVKREDDIVSIQDCFPLQNWLSSYSDAHWEGRILCPRQHAKEVTRSTKKILQKSYGIKFKRVGA
jgi:HD superfamily phosphohydrolase